MLPIQSVLNQLTDALQNHQSVVLQAPPGAGKSTFLPLHLLESSLFSGKIIMLEPRRLAAINIANYIASQLGEKAGERVGYRIRQESKVSDKTKLEVVTEGILTRMMQEDPELEGVDLVIFDEFHERSIRADLALALALDIQQGLRDDLKLLVMSATLDSEYLADFLQAPVISSEGRSYPVELFYQPQGNDLIAQLAQLVKQSIYDEQGSILVFLPGAREINQLAEQLESSELPDNVSVYPLYGDLDKGTQQRAIAPCRGDDRKVVLATNIAETSLTIDGVRIVIDSGLKRQANFNVKNGVTKLQTATIAKSSAIQRMGRAGRVMPGICYRLGSSESFERRMDFDEPEILNSDLMSLLLEVTHWGANVDDLMWLNAPPKHLLAQAEQLLLQLEMIEVISSGLRVSKLGEQVIKLGGSPRIGHMLVKAKILSEQVGENLMPLACYLAALIESPDPLPKGLRQGNCNIESRLNFIHSSQGKGKGGAIQKQLKFWLAKMKLKTASSLPTHYSGLLLALAFPDRIALKRGQGYQLSNGFGVSLNHDDPLNEHSMLVISDLVEFDKRTFVGMAATVELDDISEYLPYLITKQDFVGWDNKGEKLVGEKQTKLGQIIVGKEPLKDAITNEQRTEAFITLIKRKGLGLLNFTDECEQWLLRVNTAYSINPDDFICFSSETLLSEVDTWLAPFLGNITTVAQLKQLDVLEALKTRLDWQTQQVLDAQLPVKFKVPVGNSYKIEYRQGQNPKLSVRIQEMFGLTTNPSLMNGKLPLVIELLSPARRPIQLTQDLAGFWQGSYGEVKKEMKGRYPKHYWPDDPAVAMPTSRVKSKM